MSSSANFFCAIGRIHRRERDALDAFAVLFKIRPSRSIMFRWRQHTEQFHIVGVEHDGVIARSHMRAVGAARRHGEAESLVILGRLVEILHHDHGVIDSDDVFECHFLFPWASLGG